MNIELNEWVGYAASAVLAASFLITNVWYFRWINLVGALLFTIYGALIKSMPVLLLNGLITGIDVYFIFQMSNKVDYFHYLSNTYKESAFLRYFLRYYSRDISYHFPRFSIEECSPNQKFTFVVRNAVSVGLFSYHVDGNCAVIDLDYTIPEYRDLKNTRYLVRDALAEEFKEQGITRLCTYTTVPQHIRYIKRLGFVEDKDRSHAFHLDLPMA